MFLYFGTLGPCQAPPSMEFSRQEYWSGLPFPSPGDLRHPGIKPRFPSSQAASSPSEPLAMTPYILSTDNPIPGLSQLLRNPCAVQETQASHIRPLHWEEPLEEGMATHSSIGESHGQRGLAGYTAHEVAKSQKRQKGQSMHAAPFHRTEKVQEFNR